MALPPVGALVAHLLPSVVTISGPDGSLGSGVIVHSDGLVVTNKHVVDQATTLTVTLATGVRVPARVRVRHPQVDLALLQVEAGQPLVAAALSRSGELQVGEWVIAIGNPFGLGPSASIGIIGATGRSLGRTGAAAELIQTDAAINPGNSGGPLCDMNGNVVAIANAAVTIGQGIGFAIPIRLATEMVNELSLR